MTAKKRSGRNYGPPVLGCPWCSKDRMNEKGLQSHVRQRHPENRDEYEAQAATRRAEAAMSKKQEQERLAEEGSKLNEEEQERRQTIAEQSAADHPHTSIDGGYRHTHPWGEAPHDHPSPGGPPSFYSTAIHPDLVDREEKTDDQKEREHKAAIAASEQARLEAQNPKPQIGDGDDADEVYHVLVDGFSILGKVWYYGEEIKIRRGGKLWNDLVVDSDGRAVLDVSPDDQLTKWGVVKFRPGPWPGARRQMTEEEYTQALINSSPEDARRLEKQRQRDGMPPAPVAPSAIA